MEKTTTEWPMTDPLQLLFRNKVFNPFSYFNGRIKSTYVFSILEENVNTTKSVSIFTQMNRFNGSITMVTNGRILKRVQILVLSEGFVTPTKMMYYLPRGKRNFHYKIYFLMLCLADPLGFILTLAGNPRPTKGGGYHPLTVCLRLHKNAKESDPGI